MRMCLGVLAAAFTTTALAAGENSAMADNPFAQPSPLPMQFPPFDRIHDGDYLPAFKAGLSEQLREVAAIAHNHEAPTFENTIVALARSGQLRTRVESVFSNLDACTAALQMDRIDTEMAPKLAAQNDAIFLNEALWNRGDTLYRKSSTLHLD